MIDVHLLMSTIDMTRLDPYCIVISLPSTDETDQQSVELGHTETDAKVNP